MTTNKYYDPIYHYIAQLIDHSDKEVPGFVPTKPELLCLLKYHIKFFMDAKFDGFYYGYCNGREERVASYAWKRVEQIQELLGDEGPDIGHRIAIDYGEEKGIPKKEWEVFLYGGDEGEREALEHRYWDWNAFQNQCFEPSEEQVRLQAEFKLWCNQQRCSYEDFEVLQNDLKKAQEALGRYDWKWNMYYLDKKQREKEKEQNKTVEIDPEAPF